MDNQLWKLTLQLYRQLQGEAPHWQTVQIDINPDEYVLDAVERVWAFHDRTLVFRHACHHSTCGACGMRVNGVEKLTCITPIREVTHDGGTLRIEPLRNFPVISDLVVDMSSLYARMEPTHMSQVSAVDAANLPYESDPADGGNYERLVDCIECGCCISACPVALTTPAYLGPAVLAAAQHEYRRSGDAAVLDYVDQADGLWRCHSAYECSAVCPSNVDPAYRIMDLRRMAAARRVRQFFKIGEREVAS